MPTSPTPSPATTPVEAPEIASIKELQDKKADILSYLQSIPGLSPEEKAKFAEEFERDMTVLNAKTEEEKAKNLGSLKADIAKLQADIHGEKRDTNEEVDTVTGSDETTVIENQKLVEKEIRGRLDEFRTSIESKLATAETPPTASPEPSTEPVFLTEPTIPEDLIPPNRDYVSKTQPNWFANIILQFFGDTPWVKRWVLGFKTDKEMAYTESSMNNIT